ncbi:hypothetical protein ENZ75_13525 [Mesorhizobium sp. M7A.F.Ca.CA.002.04.1.1]|nr:hypothetical protein ENZ75_13525 [Mesorhizobium sp. M7A.F.Ca.CA.002.04.1.1]
MQKPRFGRVSVQGGNRPARQPVEQDDGAVLGADAGSACRKNRAGAMPAELGAEAAGSGGSGRSGRRRQAARMKPEAQCLTARASGPVRLSPATGTAGMKGNGRL